SKPAEPTPAPAAAPAAQPAAAPAAAKPAAVKPAAVKPVATPVEVYEPGLLDEVLANPLLLAAAGGALALLAGLGLTINSRRKSRKSAEQEAELFQQPDLSAVQPDFTPVAGLAAQADGVQSPAALTTGLQSSDPLGEAEMYSTYGRFNQAAELLRNALNDEPQRADLRLKLMEVCAEMGDREGFVRQEAELGEIGGAQPQIDQLRARYPQILASGAAIAAGTALAADVFDSEPEVAAPEPVAAARVEPADEFSFDDFSLDDLSLDAVPAAAPSAAAEPVSALDDGFDLSLDDLEAELERELAANPAAAVEAPLQLDELSLDGLDDDFASLEPAPAAEPLLEGGELDFELDLDLAAAPAGGEVAQPSAEVDDFAFELGEVQLPVVDEVLAAPQDQTEEDELLAELDQLALDAPAAPATAESDEFLLDLADLDLGESSAAPAAQAEAELAALPGLDDLELELQTLSGADAEQDLDAAFDDFLTRSELPEASAAPAPVAAVETLDELPALDELAFETTPAPALTGNEDFDFLADADETATKLDLARAYIDMGDADGARDILDEVLKEGSASQQQEAREMMGRIA
ncbi:MAG TPA: FimV/HubP family polar landmark protein, partial [Pseudomonas sp.]